MRTLFVLLLCLSLGVRAQRPYKGSLDDLYISNTLKETELKYDLKSDKIIFYQKPGVNEVTIMFDTLEDEIPHIQFDKGGIDSTLLGVSRFDMDFSPATMNYAAGTSFYVHNTLYYFIPLLPDPACNGSFCRVFRCMLVSVTQKKAFYFEEMDVAGWFYQCNNGPLIYMANQNSTGDDEDFVKWQRMDSITNNKLLSDSDLIQKNQIHDSAIFYSQPNFYYKLYPFYLDEKTLVWKQERNSYGVKYIVVKTVGEFVDEPNAKTKIVDSNW
jgi:hypothetical protein